MGSKLGWLIAVGLVLIVGGIFVRMYFFPSHSGPTLAVFNKEGFCDLKSPGLPASTVAGFEPSGPGNAADDYAAAIALFKAHDEPIAKAADMAQNNPAYVPTPEMLDLFKQLDQYVATGARKAKMEYMFVRTPDTMTLTYNRFYDCVGDFQNVAGSLCAWAAVNRVAGRYDQAAKTLQNVFIMGWHMMNERSVVDMVRRGIGIQSLAIDDLLKVYKAGGDKYASQIDGLLKYRNASAMLSAAFDDKWRILLNVHPNAGDVFYIIEKDRDRTWRCQAILSLGIVKFQAESRGDAMYTDKLLKKFSLSTDPIEAAAAKTAMSLTVQEMRGLGNK